MTAIFLSTLKPSECYCPLDDLPISPRPVTRLRLRLLAQRAAAAGFADLASKVEGEWQRIGDALGVAEDYHE